MDREQPTVDLAGLPPALVPAVDRSRATQSAGTDQRASRSRWSRSPQRARWPFSEHILALVRVGARHDEAGDPAAPARGATGPEHSAATAARILAPQPISDNRAFPAQRLDQHRPKSTAASGRRPQRPVSRRSRAAPPSRQQSMRVTPAEFVARSRPGAASGSIFWPVGPYAFQGLMDGSCSRRAGVVPHRGIDRSQRSSSHPASRHDLVQLQRTQCRECDDVSDELPALGRPGDCRRTADSGPMKS